MLIHSVPFNISSATLLLVVCGICDTLSRVWAIALRYLQYDESDFQYDWLIDECCRQAENVERL